MSFTYTSKVPLAPYTTFKIGGNAEYFTVVHDVDELREAVQFAKARDAQIIVLGGGSNVLIADEGITGLVIKNEIGGIAYEEKESAVEVTAGAGVPWDDLVLKTVSRELWGIENLSGIPGTVGGAVVQNINAYGVTMQDVLVRVTAFDITKEILVSFSNEECQFAYRNSFFKQKGDGKNFIVTDVTLKLSLVAYIQSAYRSASQSMNAYFVQHNISHPAPKDVRGAVCAVRERIGMLEGQYKSAGSFFTNVILAHDQFCDLEAYVSGKYPEHAARFSPWHWPLPDGREKISAAFLMECTEFNKTAFAGNTFNESVGISPVHTLSLINVHDATAEDIKTFANIIAEKIKEQFNVVFESEVCFL